MKSYPVEFTVSRAHFANYYSHVHTRFINLTDQANYPEHLSDIVNNLKIDIEAHRYKMCMAFFDRLNAEYDYFTSIEAIKQTIEVNEYYFNEETLEIDS